jgi:hypothetical protein
LQKVVLSLIASRPFQTRSARKRSPRTSRNFRIWPTPQAPRSNPGSYVAACPTRKHRILGWRPAGNEQGDAFGVDLVQHHRNRDGIRRGCDIGGAPQVVINRGGCRAGCEPAACPLRQVSLQRLGHLDKPIYHKGQTGTPDACYAILERSARGWSVAFRYVPYDHMSMAQLARTHGLPVWADALATGWVE